MIDTTMLFRQVHPSFVQAGKVSSQVFRPTPKDKSKLSMYNGDKIDPVKAFEHYTAVLKFSSVGVFGLEKQETDAQNIPVIDDSAPFFEHCSLDFSAFSKSQIERMAKILKVISERRGWLFQS